VRSEAATEEHKAFEGLGFAVIEESLNPAELDTCKPEADDSAWPRNGHRFLTTMKMRAAPRPAPRAAPDWQAARTSTTAYSPLPQPPAATERLG